MITPCGMYMKPRRTGGLLGFVFSSAQPMLSSSGSASATPSPRRQVRRLISQLFGMACSFGIVEAAMHKWIAGHNGHHQSLHAVAIPGNRLRQLIDDDFIVARQLPAECVGQQFAGEITAHIVAACGENLFEFLWR